MAHNTDTLLAQIREVRQKVWERQLFKGYSGRARALGGMLILFATTIMSSPVFPGRKGWHFDAWCLIVICVMAVNYGALLVWMFRNYGVRKSMRRLSPVVDVFPLFFAGCVISCLLIFNGLYDHLFGVWLLTYGLMNLSQRHFLPGGIWLLGLFYILCGTLFLLVCDTSFLNPRPVGLVLFAGEMWGGAIFYASRHPGATIPDFLWLRNGDSQNVQDNKTF